MLTDFDLSKGSSPPGRPGVVKSKSPNQVSNNKIKPFYNSLTYINIYIYIKSLLQLIPRVV